MAVDLPLCQALVQTNFPGREPVMTGLINLKRESKLTLEQKGNQGRVKILLWLQERKRGLKKKKRKEKRKERQSSCLWAPALAASSTLPPEPGAPGSCSGEAPAPGFGIHSHAFRSALGWRGASPVPRHLQNSALQDLTALNPSAGQTLAQSCAVPPGAAGTGQSPCSRQPPPPPPALLPAYLLVHFDVQPVGHLVVLKAKSQQSQLRSCQPPPSPPGPAPALLSPPPLAVP